MSLREAYKEVRHKNRESAIKKGAESELKVHSALELLRSINKIITWWPTNNWQQDVIEKTDAIIMTNDGEEIEVQVKTSKKQADLFRISHPEKLTIDVPEDEELNHLSMRILGFINKKVKK